MVFFAYRIENF
jgi:t-SNARE complex subunit (syntaxin)